MQFLTLRGLSCKCCFVALLLGLLGRKSCRQQLWCLEFLEVYLHSINYPVFVMYCICGVSRSFLLIDSMIYNKKAI